MHIGLGVDVSANTRVEVCLHMCTNVCETSLQLFVSTCARTCAQTGVQACVFVDPCAGGRGDVRVGMRVDMCVGVGIDVCLGVREQERTYERRNEWAAVLVGLR